MNDSPRLNRQEVDRVADPMGAEGERTTMVDAPALPAGPARARKSTWPKDRPAAFRALVGAALDDAYRRATVLLGDRFEAEDAVHDAAEKAWRGWGSLREPDRFDAWFARILVNTCRDRMRARRRVRRIEVEEAGARGVGVSGGFEAVDSAERLRQALDALDVDERIAVILRYEADLTVPAIATIVGVPEGTVKSRLHRALGILRAAHEGTDR